MACKQDALWPRTKTNSNKEHLSCTPMLLCVIQSLVMKYLMHLAVAGNIIYILWILYNGMDEGFRGSLVQIVAPLGLVVLLVLNIALLTKKGR